MPGAPLPKAAVAFDAAAKADLLRRAAATTPLWITGQGRSMGWTIPTGAEVLVAASTSPRRGQLWAYADEAGQLIVHRYRRRGRDGHVLQGDTCVRPDRPVRDGQLIGRVDQVRRRGRTRSVGWSDPILGASQRIPRQIIGRTVRAARRLRRRTR